MLAILLVVGLGLVVGVALGGDSEANDGEPQVFGDDDQTIASDETQGSVSAYLADLVAEGEVTQTESDAIFASIDFISGPMNVQTGAGDDGIVGSSGADRIATGAGEDLVYGGAGDDLIELGEGDDLSGVDPRFFEIDETAAAGVIDAGDAPLEAGDDTIWGGLGNDIIADGYGANTLNGNQGNDVLISVDQDGLTPDIVNGGFGRDVMIVDEGDTVTTGDQADTVTVDVFGGVGNGYQAVTITDFDPARDVVELEGDYGVLLTPPPTGPGDVPQNPITVEDTDDGDGAIISVGGIPVVLVIGGQGMTVSDVRISV